MTKWVEVRSKDELEAFYRSVLPNIITEAKYHGYAIGVHGSLRRDLDLIAVPWSADHSDKDELATAIHEAACGMPLARYQWEQKPCGRLATSFPVCWPEMPAEVNLAHIDLSVIGVAVRPEERAMPSRVVWVIEKGSPAQYFSGFDYGAGKWTANFSDALQGYDRDTMQRLWNSDDPIFTVFNDGCRIVDHMICGGPTHAEIDAHLSPQKTT